MFVNRKDELKVLNKEYKNKNATLSVIYGRRRVGKTALIGEYIKDKPHIYLYATEGNLALQLENFSKDLMKMANLPYMENAKFKNFEEAFGFHSLKFKRSFIIFATIHK